MASNKENQSLNNKSQEMAVSQNDVTTSSKNKMRSGYSQGSILKIKIKNFLTYNEVEMNPGPNLNLILGPNGSGKSSIVCAICLGLGGKPKVLGRAGNIEDYIQYEKPSALIEIDLFLDPTNIIRITREILRSGTSNWKLNNKPSNFKTIAETVRKLNIQVDNLCQFLPQDRVADFVKMTPQELLANTQKAVGNIEMHERHEKLKELRKKHLDLESNKQRDIALLESEIEKNNLLENEVKNYYEREKYQDTINLLKKKRVWVEYSVKRNEYQESKAKFAEMKEKFETSQNNIQPFHEKFKAYEKEEGRMKNQLLQSRNNFSSLQSDLKKHKSAVDNYPQLVETIEGELRGQEQDEEQRHQKLLELKHQLRKLETELRNLPENTDEVRQELSTVQGHLAKLNLEVTTIDNEKNNIKAECFALNQAMLREKESLAKEQSTYNQKLQLLRHSNRDAYQATMWLQQNKHIFKKAVYEPIMLTINVHDPKYAKFIEMQISYRDLVAFIFEDADDLEEFMKVIRDQMNLKVNSAMVPRETLDTFQPERPINQFKRYGFENYLKDLFTAPSGVMRYLCRFYNLHRVPVGTKVTTDNLERVLNDTNFTRFYTPDRMYTIRTSKYGARNKSTLSNDIRPAQNLVISMNDQVIRELQNSIRQLEETHKAKSAELKELRNTEELKTSKLEELRKRKMDLQAQRDFRKNIMTKVEQKKVAVKNNEESKIDLDIERQKAGVKIKKIYSERYKTLDKYRKILQDIREITKVLTVVTLKAFIVENNKKKAKQEYEAQTAETRELKEEFERINKQCIDVKKEAQALLQNAKKIAGIPQNENLPNIIREQFGVLPASIEDIDAQILQEQARLDLMFHVDENVIAQFEERKKNIERMQREADKVEQNVERYLQEIEELQNQWIQETNTLMENINKNFSAFFARLQCVGEVSLNVAENPLDFEKYGICIKVKFRDSEKLQELTASHQSGGERSVSTVLFMMALQELTAVPFRCVDEINQGMDSKNERKVFEFVVETASRTTSQYFLLTPKLLPKLDYSDKMMVHCINKGPQIEMGPSDFTMKNFIRRAKRYQALGLL